MGDASLTSVTEYILTQPILSFIVSGSAPIPANLEHKEFSGEESAEEEEDLNYASGRKDISDFDSKRNIVLLTLHCVHTRYMKVLIKINWSALAFWFIIF